MTLTPLNTVVEFQGGSIVYYYPLTLGQHVRLSWRDTEANREKLSAFIADRGLTVSDLRFPRRHREDRSILERIQQDGITTIGSDKPRNKADDIRDGVREFKEWRQTETWEEKTLREADEAEAAEEAALSEAERFARNEPAIDHAQWGFMGLAFSDCPAGEVSAAYRRLQVAREGTPKEYAAADAEYRERVRQNALLAQANLEGQLQQARQNVDAQLAANAKAAWVDPSSPATSPEATPQQETN